MSIAFDCPTCGKHFTLDDASAGRRARCACGAINKIPTPLAADDVYDVIADRPAPATTPPPSLPRPVVPPSIAARTTSLKPKSSSRFGGTALMFAGFAALLIAVIAIAFVQQKWKRDAAAEALVTFRPLKSLANAVWPADATWTTPAAGVRSMSAFVRNGAGLTTELVVYLPTTATAAKPVPCVFVAPAGSRMFHGMQLAPDDAREHLPYARAGLAVIAYSIGGPLDDREINDPNALRRAFAAFRTSQGGYADAEVAIAYALAARPEIDASRLYVAGHSSAGSLALLVAAKDERIKACCAYAPCADLDARLAPHAASMESIMPGVVAFEHNISPINLPAPRGRVLLFHADDDDNVPASDAVGYASRYPAVVNYVTVPNGGHYRSMIQRGIPTGIDFLTHLDERK